MKNVCQSQLMIKLDDKVLHKYFFFKIKKEYQSRIWIRSNPVFFGLPDPEPTFPKEALEKVKLNFGDYDFTYGYK